MATQQKRPKRPEFITPKGIFKFPSLTTPDYGNDEFPKPDGEFKVALIVPRADAESFIEKLNPLWRAAIAEADPKWKELKVELRKKLKQMTEQPFFEEEFDKETEEPTGNVIFKAKTKYKITDKKTNEVRYNSVKLFDSQGKPLPKGVAIYGGTTGKLSVQINPYWVAGQGMAGISLRLQAAQVITLVGPGARSADSYGFGSEDGGYEAPDASEFGDESGSDDSSSKGSSAGPEDF